MPEDVKARALSTAIDEEDQTASLELALRVAEYFDLSDSEAMRIAGEVGDAVSGWHAEAASRSIGAAECDRMASAFGL
jgi:serine/threonine-protein kinase HipA